MIPSERLINRVKQDTGMDRMQAINHLRSREIAQRLTAEKRRAAMAGNPARGTTTG